MKTSMLEHQKRMLCMVMFNSELFFKELRKSKEWLTPDELYELEAWLSSRFGKPAFGLKSTVWDQEGVTA